RVHPSHARRTRIRIHALAVRIPGRDPADTRSHGYVRRGASARTCTTAPRSRPWGTDVRFRPRPSCWFPALLRGPAFSAPRQGQQPRGSMAPQRRLANKGPSEGQAAKRTRVSQEEDGDPQHAIVLARGDAGAEDSQLSHMTAGKGRGLKAVQTSKDIATNRKGIDGSEV
ncbi:unnamed protein product, partial [Prorocentrum cordatum]